MKYLRQDVEERPQYTYNTYQKEIKPMIFAPYVNNGTRLLPNLHQASAYTSLNSSGTIAS